MKLVRTTKVAGISFDHRQNYAGYVSKNRANTYLFVSREASNAFDTNAVRVMAHVRGGKTVQLGYLPKDVAAEVAPRIDAGGRCWVESFTINRGGPKGTYGIRLTISY